MYSPLSPITRPLTLLPSRKKINSTSSISDDAFITPYVCVTYRMTLNRWWMCWVMGQMFCAWWP